MSENIRLAFLANGESVHTKKWLMYFVGKGYDVRLITFTAKPIKGVKIHELKYFSKLAYPLRILEMRKAVRKINPDILHAHFVSHYGVHGALTDFNPFIVTAWGSDILVNPQSKIYRWAVRIVFRRADLITCDAEHVKKAMIELGAHPQKIAIIYFGTDTQKFKPEQRKEKIGKELGIFDSPMIISLRNLEPIYNVEILINSIPQVLKDVPEAKFVIVGRGSQEVKLNRLAKSLGVSNSVRFVGFIPNDQIPQYLTSSDVYVSTALSDGGIAASTAEAMACRLPVIVTDVAVNRKWVEDGVNGFIVPIKDPKYLAKKIIYLLINKNVRKKYVKLNRKIVEERNNYYKEMEKMEYIYKELVQRHEK